jgi:hypothetical protein
VLRIQTQFLQASVFELRIPNSRIQNRTPNLPFHEPSPIRPTSPIPNPNSNLAIGPIPDNPGNRTYNEPMQGQVCQSCGMPMSKDEKGGGTNADGTKSAEYCSHCYKNGTWMLDMSVDEMQRRVGGLLKQRGASDNVLRDATSGIPTLKRWKR